jgi:hypothetical protein
MRPIQGDGEESENAANAGESGDPPDGQMRFDFDG